MCKGIWLSLVTNDVKSLFICLLTVLVLLDTVITILQTVWLNHAYLFLIVLKGGKAVPDEGQSLAYKQSFLAASLPARERETEKVRALLCLFLRRALIPFMRAPSSSLISQRSHLLISHWRISTYGFCRDVFHL